MTKILIVDDDKEFCASMADILEAKGYEVESENSGEAAIAKVKEKSFDVVLMDIKMPAMNGVEAFKKIKEISPKTVVIMITAYSLEDLIKEALREGAFGVLRKPLDIDKLIEQIGLAKERGMLILITDDDPNTRETFKDVLEAKGYKVATAATGEEAIERSRERPSDILFMDMKLSALNGLETYLAIKEINPKVIAVIITGYYEETKDLVDKALEKGVYTYLKKPLDMDKVLDLIEEINKKVKK
ncbi:MAG: response regulator [bacterium]|nr:response regulator [bacterium]